MNRTRHPETARSWIVPIIGFTALAFAGGILAYIGATEGQFGNPHVGIPGVIMILVGVVGGIVCGAQLREYYKYRRPRQQ